MLCIYCYAYQLITIFYHILVGYPPRWVEDYAFGLIQTIARFATGNVVFDSNSKADASE